jgi:regulation of enolase protein 1 (concanavalin A-like superfamily)
MIRDSLDPGSAHAFMLVSKGRGLAFQYRPADGAATAHLSGGTGTAPRWVRLTRAGNLLTASVSTDGTTWTTVGQVSVSLGTTVWAGLAVTSHDTRSLASATFGGVVVSD